MQAAGLLVAVPARTDTAQFVRHVPSNNRSIESSICRCDSRSGWVGGWLAPPRPKPPGEARAPGTRRTSDLPVEVRGGKHAGRGKKPVPSSDLRHATKAAGRPAVVKTEQGRPRCTCRRSARGPPPQPCCVPLQRAAAAPASCKHCCCHACGQSKGRGQREESISASWRCKPRWGMCSTCLILLTSQQPASLGTHGTIPSTTASPWSISGASCRQAGREGRAHTQGQHGQKGSAAGWVHPASWSLLQPDATPTAPSSPNRPAHPPPRSSGGLSRGRRAPAAGVRP